MIPSVPCFGTRLPGQDYIFRPSAYVVLRDSRGLVAIVHTPFAVFLPGGGQLPGESPEDAAVREVAEECGLRAELLAQLGVADQFTYSEQERVFFEKRSTFFRARVTGEALSSEVDHILEWLPSEAAELALSHESHRWAVAEERRR